MATKLIARQNLKLWNKLDFYGMKMKTMLKWKTGYIKLINVVLNHQIQCLPVFKQLQQEEYLKYEQRLADEEEARMLAKWGESGKPPEEFSGLYRRPANIMDAIKDPMNMTL